MNNNQDEFFVVPPGREMLAQTVLLYEMSLPFGMGLEDRIDIEKSATRLSVQLHSLNSDQLIAFDQRVQGWAKNNCPDLQLSSGSGLDVVFANISQRNIESLVIGTIVSLVSISLILIFVLKSLRLGLISMIPNMVPAAMAYGFWGMTVGRIDLALSIVGTMSLGLVVDDTIHFLYKYQYARSELRKNVYDAIEFSFKTVGVAMLVTSVILAAGFGLLFFSHFAPTWTMGSLLAVTVIFALIADFFLLPGLLVLLDKNDYTENKG